jgi:hypothetical protein
LVVAAALAANAGCPLAIWVPAEREDDFKTLREQARAALARHDGVAKILWLRSREPRAVAQAVDAEAPAVLLWYDPLDSERLAMVLNALHCPLVLVN